MADPRIPLKKAWLAGILAFLLPGAGHLYQGRYFKAALYFVCILGLFLTGMAMAEWQAVQPPMKGAFRQGKVGSVLKFVAQAGVGTPALFGLIQRERFESPRNVPVTTLTKPMSVPFQGIAAIMTDEGNKTGSVNGTMTLKPSDGQFGRATINGEFKGEMDGKPVEFQLSDFVQIAPPIGAEKARPVSAGIQQVRNGRLEEIGHLRGAIPRSFWNWFEVPMDAMQEEDLHRRLGKYHELAMVFTWIAGLLNVLAIWDAVEGPAYGYGDEKQPEPEPVPPPA
jgi:TM2 domain.